MAGATEPNAFDPLQQPPPSADPLPAETPPPARGWHRTAWTVILLTLAALLGQRYAFSSTEETTTQDSRLGLIVLEMQARYLVGAQQFLGPLADLYLETQTLQRGNIDQRLRFVALAGEMKDPTEALRLLTQLDEQVCLSEIEWTEAQQHLRRLLGLLYHDLDEGEMHAPSLTPHDREFVVEEMGWFGVLALHPPPRLPWDPVEVEAAGGSALVLAREPPAPLEGRAAALQPAVTTFLTLAVAFSVAAVLIAIGLAGMVVFAVVGPSLRWRLATGSPHGGIYAETFALWLIGYFGLNLLMARLIHEGPVLAQSILLMLASLSVLAWPLVRGVSWQQLRQDIGLFCPRHPAIEMAAGLWCYLVNLPLVVLGLAITVGLLALQTRWKESMAEGGVEDFSSAAGPAHPIFRHLTGGDVSSILQLYILASFVAPLVEEILFRGLLHRHCREATRSWRPGRSALASTTVVSVLFASLHPQGLLTIPVLMFMAFGFSLAREWRGSLLPSMFAHGLSNGSVITIALLALSR